MDKDRFVDLCFWRMIAPMAIFAILWGVYFWIIRLDHSFERVFAYGDLMVFSGLILMEASVEADLVRKGGYFSRITRQLLRFGALAVVLVFGFVRYDAMVQEGGLVGGAEGADAVEVLRRYSYFSIGVAMVALLFSIAMFWSVVNAKVREQLEVMSEPKG